MNGAALPLLLLLAVSRAGCYIEVVEERRCHDEELRLTCRRLNAVIAILEATFTAGVNYSCVGPHDGNVSSTDAPAAAADRRHLRLAVNHRCSGVNHCSFILEHDYKPAVEWGPGTVYLKYACMDKTNLSRFCNGDIVVSGEGFVQTPGYPHYYEGQKDCRWTVRAPAGQRVQLQLLDVSLRVIGPLEANCTDQLQVMENDRLLLSTCGEEEDLIEIISEGNALNITITTASKKLFPKRGVLFHYKALGCLHPPSPQDGYVVFRNNTYGEYMCCVGYAFPDTLQRTRILQCVNNNTWSTSLPDCTNTSYDQWGPMRLKTDSNNTNYEVAAIVKESDLMFDVLLPTVIICVLLVGNGVIIFIIYHLRRRKLPRDSDEDELGAIFQPQDGSEKAISV